MKIITMHSKKLLPIVSLVTVTIVAGCGGSSSSGAGARFLETEIMFRNTGDDIECDNVIVEKGALDTGGNFAQCTWPCAVGGPRDLTREFYVRRWSRTRSSEPYRFESDRVDVGICL